MQTVTLRFTSLANLLTFSHMVGHSLHQNTSELTVSGSISQPYISIAQTLFDATRL